MAEENAPHDSTGMPPPTEGDASLREKKKSKISQGKLFMIVLGGMVLIAGYALLSGDESPRVPGSEEEVSVGGAEIEGEVESFGRNEGTDGGVGQERAEVLSEIDEREALQRRIEGGKSAVRFGEPLVDDEKKDAPPEPPKERKVFGDVAPREEKPKTTGRRPPQVAPISGTASPQAYRNDGAGANMAGLEYELGLVEEQPMVSTNVNYYVASTSRGGAGRDQAHPLTPELSKKAEKASRDVLALPGDLTVAYLSNRISSDQPSSRVRADILAGDLRGARMLGEASFEGERLIINFDQLVYEDEVYDSVHAVAVDPDTLDASVQDGINRRLFTRYGVPILAGIASIGIDYQANRNNPSITETNLSTGETVSRRSNDADSFGKYAASEAGDGLKKPFEAIATNAASTPPEVWANPGAIGLMFTTEVVR